MNELTYKEERHAIRSERRMIRNYRTILFNDMRFYSQVASGYKKPKQNSKTKK